MPLSSPRKVLVVDDEPLVRTLIAESLIDAGYVVLQAANAAEALAILRGRPDVLGVLSDVDMPGGMNGISLAWEIARECRNLPVTLISGRASPTASMLPDGVVFLAKPCPMDVIALHVARMVDVIVPAQAVESGVVVPFERRADEA